MDQTVIFRDLLSHEPKLPPAESQRRAAAELPARVRLSALEWWPDRTDTNGTGSRLVIGVAVWSNYDLRLLDLANQALGNGGLPGIHVSVLDIDELTATGDIQRVFPGVEDVLQTPVVGYWEAGVLKETATGFFARQLAARILAFDPKLVLEQPTKTAG